MTTARCRTCDERGAPVEGMTGICRICGEVFCFGHLGNHNHRLSEIRSIDVRLSVMGVGRVGSYAKAAQSHRSRNRRYWTIAYFDPRCKPECRCYRPGRGHYPIGPREAQDAPHFRTMREAEAYLAGLR